MSNKLRIISMVLALVSVLSMSACSEQQKTVSSSGTEAAVSAETSVNYTALKLGTDYTDLTADLKIITNRTDLIEANPDARDFQDFIQEFNAMYPNIAISYEGITNYDDDMTTRLTSNDWGDICCIPATVAKSELNIYFEPIAGVDELDGIYQFVDKNSYSGMVYGIPTTGNVQGIVYNKKIWADAGISEIPATPDEFLKDLNLIKEKTDAIPLYTNYAAGWTLTAWDGYITGCATGDANFKNQILSHASNPFAEKSNHTGPYEVYHILYEAVSQGLTEEDPTTTDWESCKGRINNGEISAMVLGSWAIPQMQGAGEHTEDIAYMPFPISVDGTVYASASGDYCCGINKNCTEDEKIASMLYLKYFTEQSNYAYDQGGIPIVKGEKYPDTLSAFEGLSMIVNAPALDGEEDYYNIVNNDSELSLDADSVHVARIIEAAETGSETFEDIINDWNARWTSAQERNGIEIRD